MLSLSEFPGVGIFVLIRFGLCEWYFAFSGWNYRWGECSLR